MIFDNNNSSSNNNKNYKIQQSNNNYAEKSKHKSLKNKNSVECNSCGRTDHNYDKCFFIKHPEHR